MVVVVVLCFFVGWCCYFCWLVLFFLVGVVVVVVVDFRCRESLACHMDVFPCPTFVEGLLYVGLGRVLHITS